MIARLRGLRTVTGIVLGVAAGLAGLALVVAAVNTLWPAQRAAGSPVGRLARPPALLPRVAALRPAEPAAAIPARGGLLVPDAGGRLAVPLADEVPSRLPADGVPPGWTLREFAGRAAVDLLRTDAGLALRLRSDRASFALLRDAVVDLRQFPTLAWTWKVTRLPARGDIRHAATDDQAAQVYVVFPRWPSPRTQSEVIGYVWDTSAPVGTRLVSPKAGNVRILVVESGEDRLGTWTQHRRNVLEDYRSLFGGEAPRVGGVALMIDADDTRGQAEALIAGLAFVRAAAEHSKMPTPVLR
jgi:hypothetical protein